MKTKTATLWFLDVMSAVLLLNMVMDFYLWTADQYMVPSWTLAAMSMGVFAICQVLARYVKKED